MKAFVFDAYGTLFDVYSVAALADRLFPGHGAALAQRWRTKQLQYTWLRSLMHRYENFRQVTEAGLVHAAASLSLDLTKDATSQLMDSYNRLATFDDVKPGLEALKALNVRLAILSNGEPRMLESAVNHAGLATLLDATLSVDLVNIFKPSPRVYDLAASQLKIDPRQIGFVSANSWDIHGAGSAGLTTFWLQRTPGEPSDELGFKEHHQIRAITELTAYLTRS